MKKFIQEIRKEDDILFSVKQVTTRSVACSFCTKTIHDIAVLFSQIFKGTMKLIYYKSILLVLIMGLKRKKNIIV